ncbi:MAG TPA: hypothetical protein GXZ65_08750 [Clostridiales bacterium]|jgi:V/A-type H+-transporting ATPase subunit E|nr:hypothetical protein [Clostridiales bacterium]
MKGIEKITKRILDDARQEVSAIEAEAAAECDRIRSKYKALADAEYKRLIAEGEQSAEKRFELLVGSAELEAKKQILSLKQELLGEAYSLAEKKLAELPEAEYTQFLASLAAKASRNGEELLLLSPADREKVGKVVEAEANRILASQGRRAGLRLSDKTASIRGGVILEDGRIEINCSIEALVASCRNELAGEVAKILFN